MSIIDKALGAITPPESDEKREEATRKAREAAGDGDWLALALEHHDLIREAFEVCCQADGAEDRQMAMKRLALVLNGHSQAEEVVLYPAMAKAGEKGSADLAYTEQTTAKMQMAELERYAEEFKRYTGAPGPRQGNLLRESESRSWDMAETRPDTGMQ
jgi:hypothetical protein